MTSKSLSDLRTAFRRFAQVEARDLASPMYEELAYGVSKDDDLLEIASQTNKYQPAPNMLFAAVQYLLLRGINHSLTNHYPVISGRTRSDESPFPDFRNFCLRHREPVVELIRNRRTQTNVVRRCTCLLPVFSLVSKESGLPLALVDIGASAGLNLNFDRYYYTYEHNQKEVAHWGMVGSKIHLKSDLRGSGLLPPLSCAIPVASRDGIDLDPVDLTNPDQLLWLRALIWPEHVDRHQQLMDAARELRQSDIQLHRGGAVDVLPTLMSSMPQEHAMVVYSTIALYQFPTEDRKRLTHALLVASENRPIWRIALEGNNPTLSITRYRDGSGHSETLADASPHGWWINWR